MTVKMILAVDRGNAIGWEDGRLPWKISEDMKRFKALTIDHDVVMGRKTFDSFKRPMGLPQRTNFVITRNKSFCPDPERALVKPYDCFESMVKAHQQSMDGDTSDLWVIGGATIYKQAIDLQLVDEIYLTLVDANSGADVVLPFDLSAWKLFVVRQRDIGVQWNLEHMSTPAKTDDGLSYTFITLKKAK